MQPRNITSDVPVNADLDAVAVADAGNTQAVVDWLLPCVQYPLPPTPGTGLDAYMGRGSWLSRAVVAWFKVRRKASIQDRILIDDWLLASARTVCEFQKTNLRSNFPNRENGDYSVFGNDAATFTSTGKAICQGGSAISLLATYYNNRRACQDLFIGLAGVLFECDALIAEVKRYIKEWITYSVYPQGHQGEFYRADDYGVPGQGFIYGAANIGFALTIAFELAKRGDFELFDFSTTAGRWGTESPVTPKTIWTAFDLHVSVLLGEKSIITPAGNTVNAFNPQNRRSMHPSWYWPAAKMLRRDSSLKKWAETPTPSGNTDDDPYGPWHGMCAIYGDARTA